MIYGKMARLTYADLAQCRALKDGLCPACGRLVREGSPVVVTDGVVVCGDCAAKDMA